MLFELLEALCLQAWLENKLHYKPHSCLLQATKERTFSLNLNVDLKFEVSYWSLVINSWKNMCLAKENGLSTNYFLLWSHSSLIMHVRMHSEDFEVNPRNFNLRTKQK